MHVSTRTAMTRGVALFAATVALAMGSATSATAEARPGPTGPPMNCPAGMQGKMTLEQALVRYAGYYTEEQIRAAFDDHDVNDNGYFCYRIDPMHLDRFYPLVIFFELDDFEGAVPG